MLHAAFDLSIHLRIVRAAIAGASSQSKNNGTTKKDVFHFTILCILQKTFRQPESINFNEASAFRLPET